MKKALLLSSSSSFLPHIPYARHLYKAFCMYEQARKMAVTRLTVLQAFQAHISGPFQEAQVFLNISLMQVDTYVQHH